MIVSVVIVNSIPNKSQKSIPEQDNTQNIGDKEGDDLISSARRPNRGTNDAVVDLIVNSIKHTHEDLKLLQEQLLILEDEDGSYMDSIISSSSLLLSAENSKTKIEKILENLINQNSLINEDMITALNDDKLNVEQNCIHIKQLINCFNLDIISFIDTIKEGQITISKLNIESKDKMDIIKEQIPDLNKLKTTSNETKKQLKEIKDDVNQIKDSLRDLPSTLLKEFNLIVNKMPKK